MNRNSKEIQFGMQDENQVPEEKNQQKQLSLVDWKPNGYTALGPGIRSTGNQTWAL